MIKMNNFFDAGLIVGFAGDWSLQLTIPTFGTDNAKSSLMPYFNSWGPIQSVVVAGVFTGIWAHLLSRLTQDNGTYIVLAVLLDDFYREFHPWIFPSLSTYYQGFSQNQTRLYNAMTAVPIIMVKKMNS